MITSKSNFVSFQSFKLAFFSALIFTVFPALCAETPRLATALPAEVIDGKCPSSNSKGRPILMKFQGIKIDQDGVLKLKRRIKIGPVDNQVEVPENLNTDLPYQNINAATNKTPFDMVVGDAADRSELVRIKIMIKKQNGAKFFGSGVADGQYVSVRAGPGESEDFCNLSPIDYSDPSRESITFSIKSGRISSFAIGIMVPEVDDDNMPTGLYLPIFIDPNVRNKG